MATKTHDLVATVGEYTDRSGETKKRYQKCGAAFTDEQGRISLKLDALPVSPEWSGWISLYEPRDGDGGRQPRDGQQTTQRHAPHGGRAAQDDIPF